MVEVVEGGKWKRICADETFDGREAMVICRQLGYGGNAAPVVIEEASDEAPSAIYHLVCNGTESSISVGAWQLQFLACMRCFLVLRSTPLVGSAVGLTVVFEGTFAAGVLLPYQKAGEL